MGPTWPCSVQRQPQGCPEAVPLIASPNCTLGYPCLLTSRRETHSSRDRKPATNAAYVGLVLSPRQTLLLSKLMHPGILVVYLTPCLPVLHPHPPRDPLQVQTEAELRPWCPV